MLPSSCASGLAFTKVLPGDLRLTLLVIHFILLIECYHTIVSFKKSPHEECLYWVFCVCTNEFRSLFSPL